MKGLIGNKESFLINFIYYSFKLLRSCSPQINNNTDRTLDDVLSRYRGFSFTITLRQSPKGVTLTAR